MISMAYRHLNILYASVQPSLTDVLRPGCMTEPQGWCVMVVMVEADSYPRHVTTMTVMECFAVPAS